MWKMFVHLPLTPTFVLPQFLPIRKIQRKNAVKFGKPIEFAKVKLKD
jgi:hypothetical protein